MGGTAFGSADCAHTVVGLKRKATKHALIASHPNQRAIRTGDFVWNNFIEYLYAAATLPQ
jgi:hypothetical protein